jgi:hypothetical protein
MKALWIRLGVIGVVLLLAGTVQAQDYRARLQGQIADESRGALPGVTVTLVNEATGVTATRVTDAEGRYLFDFVEPGSYTVNADLQGFRSAAQKAVRVSQRGDVTVDLLLGIATVAETITVQASSVLVQFNSSSSDLTLERQLVDQVPISGRNPYNLANLDPSIVNTPGTTAAENRPYHHAYANDYDAGGGTRRANAVLLDGVPLGASYKTSYTPSMDAVEEITVSKNSVDAENGNSLGGLISLNMKSGTNTLHGSAYMFGRDPSLNSISDPTIRIKPGQDTTALRGTELTMWGATIGGPIKRNKIFSFTSFEDWNDKRPLTVVRTVPTELERRGDFSQSVLSGRVRTIYNPFTSTLDASGRVIRQPFAGNQIPSAMFDPVAVKMLNDLPLPNLPGNIDNWQGSVYENTNYWNFSQRVDLNFTDSFKMFARYGQFKADLYQENPTESGFFPLSGSNRDGMSTAADAVWIISNKMTVNVRGSYYNMVDEFYNPSLELGEEGLANYWPTPWYSSLYNSGYVYYPALDVTSGTGTATTNRLGRQGREWYQHPDAWTASARMNYYLGTHNMKWGGEMRSYFGEAARFEPINLVFNSALTANSSDTPDVTNSGNQWATFMLGALDSQTSARLVPLQEPDLKSYAAYFQDDWNVNDRLTLNLGVRWEYEPGATDPLNRLSQRLDLTAPIPEMQATPPVMPAQATQLMGSKGYAHAYNGEWVFVDESDPYVWSTSALNFMPRLGAAYRIDDKSVVRAGYARFLMPITNVRDTLGDFVNQYTGYAQNSFTLGLLNGVPQQRLADPFPSNNPVIEPYGQAYGRYTGLGGAVSLDQYELRPQVNDRINFSYQREMWWKTVLEANYFLNLGTRVPYDINRNMMDPAFRYEQKQALNATVNNPFFGYLTPDKFPGALRNNRTVTLGSLLVPYPQYGTITQTNTDGKKLNTQTLELRGQRPFHNGFSVLVAYAYNHERIQQWFDDIANYRVLTSGGEQGWEWRPTDTPAHRLTTALTWLIPVGRGRAIGTDWNAAVDAVLGNWQYTASGRFYSGRPVFFNTSYVVSGNPKLDSPTRDRWFDTTRFAVQDSFTPRNNPWIYDGLNGPAAAFTDMTLTKTFNLNSRYRLEARLEAYNVFNTIVWDQPDVNISSANFGKVTRKRVDSNGREMQIGVRFVF